MKALEKIASGRIANLPKTSKHANIKIHNLWEFR